MGTVENYLNVLHSLFSETATCEGPVSKPTEMGVVWFHCNDHVGWSYGFDFLELQQTKNLSALVDAKTIPVLRSLKTLHLEQAAKIDKLLREIDGFQSTEERETDGSLTATEAVADRPESHHQSR